MKAITKNILISFIMKCYKLNVCVLIQACRFYYPLPHLLKLLLILYTWDPYLYYLHLFFYFWPNSIYQSQLAYTLTNKCQNNILPDFIAFVFIKSEDKGSSFEVLRILPDRFYILLEEIKVGVILMFAWSFAMLIDCPELLNCINNSDRHQALIEFLLNRLVLIPEFQFSGQLQLFLIHKYLWL